MKTEMIKKQPATPSSWHTRWPQWVGYIASIWSLLFGLLGLYWLAGGAGYPFGQNDVRGRMMGSFLSNLDVNVGGPVISIVGIVGAGIAILMAKGLCRRFLCVVMITFAFSISIIFLFIVPDTRIVQNFAYLFFFYFDLIDWRVIYQLYCIVGGFLWGATGLAYFRLTRGACGHCGRKAAIEGLSVKTAANLGKWFTYLAAILALPYGIVRWSWALGIPLGTTNLEIYSNNSMHIAEFILGGLCIGGGILILGLIQKWGEIFPLWCLFLAGKPVPIWFVVGPVTFISIMITATGIKHSPIVLWMMMNGTITFENMGEFGPFLFWLPWGIALGIANLFYYLRRRGRCIYCGNAVVYKNIR